MNFFTVRDLRSAPKNIWDSLTDDGEVVITNNGKPSALIFPITGENFEETLRAFRQARAMLAIQSVL